MDRPSAGAHRSGAERGRRAGPRTIARATLLPLLVGATLWLASPLGSGRAAAEDSVEDALAGFDTPELPEAGGSDEPDRSEQAARADDIDDVLAGFDDEPDPSAGAAPSSGDRFFELTGSLSLGAAINVVPHRSSLGPGDDASEILSGTDYVGLQQLRSRGDLQLDVDLPADWKLRAQGFMWFDFAYLIHGRTSYTDAVLDDYEFVTQILDLYVAGTVFERLDMKLGRQVVNWGRSDTLRVTDVLNALDNRDPGLTDIENLRLPATMAKLDYFVGPFALCALVIPEIRYDINPPAGSDFFTLPDLGDLPPPVPDPLPPLDPASLDLEDQRASQWGSKPEYGGSIDAIFSGWDASFYVARIYQNQSTLTASVPTSPVFDLMKANRVTMVGGGGNYTFGSWLLKSEVAWFKDLEYVFLSPIAGAPFYEVLELRSGRVDLMGGVEYYGFTDTTLALEIVNRHVMDYDPLLQYFPNYVEKNSVEYALRVSNDWLNARLHTTLVGIVLGAKAEGGAILRAQVDYDLLDALVVTGGFVGYVPSIDPPLSGWGRNQRLFAKIKYSF